MASTAITGAPLLVTGIGLNAGAGTLVFAHGISVLSTGTVELVTGLSRVVGFWATALNTTDTETVCFQCKEDLPSIGTITVDGTKLDEGAAVANAGSEQFCWLALGYK